MKQTIFTTTERFLLQEVFIERMAYFNSVLNELSSISEKKHYENSHIKPLRSALAKILRHDPLIITVKEKTACIICINIQIEEYCNELKSVSTLSWLTISDHLRQVAIKLDNSKDILTKCGYNFKDDINFMLGKEFRFGDILAAIEKLKQTDKVLLSRNGQHYYKIAFVYEDEEYLLFSLDHQIVLKDFKFSSLNGQLPENMANIEFSIVTNKLNANKLILSDCNYAEGVFDLMKLLLV